MVSIYSFISRNSVKEKRKRLKNDRTIFSRISMLKDESDLQTCSEIISAAYF